jgi:uncharacterized protein (TIGR03067 family)
MDMLAGMIVVVLLGVSGCSAVHKSDSARLQGTWKGDEVGASAKGECSLVISGAHWEFRGGDTNEWFKGNFVLGEDANPKQMILTITECPASQYIGKISYALYRLENDTVTVAANEPGSTTAPLSFDAAGNRQFVLKKQ